jgi:hypothetical protein
VIHVVQDGRRSTLTWSFGASFAQDNYLLEKVLTDPSPIRLSSRGGGLVARVAVSQGPLHMATDGVAHGIPSSCRWLC